MDSEGGMKENLKNRHQIREQQEKIKEDVFIHQKGHPGNLEHFMCLVI